MNILGQEGDLRPGLDLIQSLIALLDVSRQDLVLVMKVVQILIRPEHF